MGIGPAWIPRPDGKTLICSSKASFTLTTRTPTACPSKRTGNPSPDRR